MSSAAARPAPVGGALPRPVPNDDIRFDPVDLIRRRLQRNQNALIAMTGQTGSGKSLAALYLAWSIDPDFTAEQVVFRVVDFLDLLDELEPGRVIIFDEAGVDFDARRSGSKGNVGFSNILKTFRYKQLPTIFTLPRLTMLDVNGRRLFHYWLKTAGIDYKHSLCKTHWFCIDSEDDWSDRIKRYFPRVINKETGERAVITWVKWPLPPDKIRIPYEKYKNEFVTAMNQEIRQSMMKMRHDELGDEADEPPAPPRARAPSRDPALSADDLEMLAMSGKHPPAPRPARARNPAVNDAFMSGFDAI